MRECSHHGTPDERPCAWGDCRNTVCDDCAFEQLDLGPLCEGCTRELLAEGIADGELPTRAAVELTKRWGMDVPADLAVTEGWLAEERDIAAKLDADETAHEEQLESLDLERDEREAA